MARRITPSIRVEWFLTVVSASAGTVSKCLTTRQSTIPRAKSIRRERGKT